LSKVPGLSVDTIKEYLGYLGMAFLVKPLEKWTTSWSEKVYSQKKFYLWDNGAKTLLTGHGDEGSRAENAVFLELQRNNLSCGYYAEKPPSMRSPCGSSCGLRRSILGSPLGKDDMYWHVSDGIIPKEYLKTFQNMASLRNMLVRRMRGRGWTTRSFSASSKSALMILISLSPS